MNKTVTLCTQNIYILYALSVSPQKVKSSKHVHGTQVQRRGAGGGSCSRIWVGGDAAFRGWPLSTSWGQESRPGRDGEEQKGDSKREAGGRQAPSLCAEEQKSAKAST